MFKVYYINNITEYIKYIISNINPLNLVKVLSLLHKPYNQMIIQEDNNHIKSSMYAIVKGTLDIVAPNPNIKQKFIIQEPTIFPSAKSSFCFIIATTEVTSSGRDVPSATIVRLITLSGILSIVAIVVELFTTKSPPYFNAKPPKII